MQQSCSNCGTSFNIAGDDLKFYEKISPVYEGKKYDIPPPELCPDCRQQSRLLICNEFTLYKGECGMCNKNVVTEFRPDRSFPIYCRPCYLSDKWDPLSYGKDIDYSRPFFEQFKELNNSIPHQHLNVDGEIQNSEYIHFAGTSKNCYLIMHADFCEDCYYGYGFKKNRSCVDGFYNLHCELCFGCTDVHKSYQLISCQDSTNCTSSAFLRDCIGCKNCFLCTGLRQKEFCFENEQLSKAEYEKRVAKIDLGSHAQFEECKMRMKALELKHTFKEFIGHNTENCFGNHLNNCKDVRYSFDCEDVENGKYCYQLVLGSKDNYDIYQFGTNLQQSYYSSIVGEDSYHSLFCYLNYQGCSELFYCTVMDACKDCFGCTNLRKNRYCILNKQYTQEEYEKTVATLIEHMQETGEWGKFYPPDLAHCAYNESTAQLWYPLTKDEAIKKGFQWTDYEPPDPPSDRVIDATALPDNINDIPEDVTNWAIRCEVTGKPFKITKQEYQYYKKHHLPIPRRGWYQRHLDRFHLRNPRGFWHRQCDKCKKDIQTTYAPERPETVYCEKCYLKEVY
jgi:hypothetical protein